jgi:fimbrial isopeptide formation D2 family protein/LPXTG-motif cell wall-anchored protein
MKKLVSIVLALAMILMVAMASAATITIEPQKPSDAAAATTQPTYNYYVMMKASVGENNAISYYVEDQTHANALDGLKVGNDDLFTVTKAAGSDRWNVTINKKADNSAFTGVEVATALQTIKTTNYGSGTATAGDNGKSTVSISGDGYVLIESSLGTALIVDTFTTDTVQEKNNYPGNTKTENKENAEIGEVVTYTVEVSIPATVAEKNIVVVDTPSDGLTLNTSITVTGAGTSEAAALTSLTFVAGEGGVYNATIPAAKVIANAGNTLTLTYTATVNENAVVDEPETNSAHIVYDNFVTTDVTVLVETFGFDLEKVDKDNHDTKLEGVTFTLTNAAGEYYTIPSDAESVDEDRFVALASGATAPTVATNSQGKVTFAGLHAGDYTLTEITNPNAGYNMLTAPITVTVADDGTVTTGDGATVQSKVVTVENGKGTILPSTGGIGTTIFYIVGGVLLIGAAVILVARRKAHD